MWNLTYPSKYIFIFISVLLLLPLVYVEGPGKWNLHLGVPTVVSGDEPHYLVIINSLLKDGDFDLKNNYASVHEGSFQAGKHFMGFPLEHHALWHIGDKKYLWWEIFETDIEKWKRDSKGHLIPIQRKDAPVDVSNLPEYGTHPPGLAFLLAPILYPFRGTRKLEPMALFCSAIAVILAMAFFRMLLKGYTNKVYLIDCVTALTFLGTPIWHYGRSLFTEPYLLLFGLGAYALALRKEMNFLAGCFIGAAMLMKPPFLILAIPLLLNLLWQKKFKALIYLTLPTIFSSGLIFFMNYKMFGSPFKTSIALTPGNFKEGVLGLWFNVEHGIFAFAPVAVVALIGWPKLLKENPRESLVVGFGFVLYFLFMASLIYWPGGWCYGPRYVVPILPFLLVGLVKISEISFFQKSSGITTVLLICAVSIFINFLGAFQHSVYWSKHPVLHLLSQLK